MNPVSLIKHTKQYQQSESEISNPSGYVRVANYLIGDENNKVNTINGMFQTSKIYKLISLLTNSEIQINSFSRGDDIISELLNLDDIYELNKQDCFSQILKRFFLNYLTKVDMIKKCKAIFTKFNITFDNINNDFTKPKTFLPLLRCLNDIDEIYSSSTDINSDQLRSLIIKSNIPYFLEPTSFDNKDMVLIMSQIYAILERIDMKPFESYFSDDFFYIERDNIQKPILKVINGLVYKKLGWNFNKLTQIIDPQYFPSFVNIFFNDPFLTKISEKKSDDVRNETIDFLKSKIDIFKCLFFYFDDEHYIKESVNLIISNLLNFAFLKMPKEKMIERCDILIGSKMRVKTMNDFKDGFPFVYLLHLLLYKNLKLKKDPSCFHESYEIMYEYCTQLKIPLVIDYEQNPEKNSEIILYQLQFIFNVIENSPILKFIEQLKTINTHIQKIHVPEISSLYASIKNKSFLFKLHTNDLDNNQVFNEIETVPRPTRFEERYQPNSINNTNNDENNQIDDIEEIEELNEELNEKYQKGVVDFWNRIPETNISFSNGIIVEYDQENYQFEEQWNKELEPFKNNEISIISNHPNGGKYNFETKLYKYAQYDESSGKWIRNLKGFHFFYTNNKITLEYSKTPLILFMDSDENNVISIMSKLINGQYPNLNFVSEEEDEKETEGIFLYLICERNLGSINVTPNFKNPSSIEIRPIFALIHIPESKKNLPNMKSILLNIYSHLYNYAKLSVVVLDKSHIYDQIEFIKQVEKVSMEFERIKSEITKCIENKNKNKKDEISKYSIRLNKKTGNDNPPKIILLLNEKSDNLDNQSFQQLNKSYLISMIQQQLSIPSFACFINLSRFDSYQTFFEKINEFLLQTDYPFPTLDDITFTEQYIIKHTNKLDKMYDKIQEDISDSLKSRSKKKEKKEKDEFLKSKLQTDLELKKKRILRKYTDNIVISNLNYCYFGTIFSQRLIRIILQLDSVDEILNQRYLSLISEKIGKNESIELLTNEIIKYLPNEPEIRQAFTLFKLKIVSKGNDISTIVESELKKSSDEQIKYMIYRVNQKVYWSSAQIKMFIHSHMQILNSEFFSIIRIVNNDLSSYADDLFGAILEKQKNIDKKRIDDIFSKFSEKINKRKMQTLRSMKDEMKKSMQYVLKERENIKEIKVALEVGQSLETEIEQDF